MTSSCVGDALCQAWPLPVEASSCACLCCADPGPPPIPSAIWRTSKRPDSKFLKDVHNNSEGLPHNFLERVSASGFAFLQAVRRRQVTASLAS